MEKKNDVVEKEEGRKMSYLSPKSVISLSSSSKVFVPFLERRYDKKCGCCNILRKNYWLGLAELKKRKKSQFISIRQYNKDRSNYFVENKCVDTVLFSDVIEIFGSDKK